MGSDNSLYFIHCLSPVHVGAGQGTGIVDMPMIREKMTAWPYLPGSSLKGVHREYFRAGQDKQAAWLDEAFGKRERTTDEGNAGALVISDARLLAFPVASQYGVFAYVTCPLAIQRLHRDIAAIGDDMPELKWAVLRKILEQNNVVSLSKNKIMQNGKVIIDEFESKSSLEYSFEEWVKWLAERFFADDAVSQTMLKERIVLVTDDAFQYFVTMCSEIVTRIGLEHETGTIQEGALWTEEYLPAESLLYGIIRDDNIPYIGELNKERILPSFPSTAYLQIGAHATVGKGRIRCSYVKGGGQ